MIALEVIDGLRCDRYSVVAAKLRGHGMPSGVQTEMVEANHVVEIEAIRALGTAVIKRAVLDALGRPGVEGEGGEHYETRSGALDYMRESSDWDGEGTFKWWCIAAGTTNPHKIRRRTETLLSLSRDLVDLVAEDLEEVE